jgi:hypothetical protein
VARSGAHSCDDHRRVAASVLGRPRLTQDIDALAIIPDADWADPIESAARYGIVPRIGEALEFARRSRVLLLKHPRSGIDVDVTLGDLPFEHAAVEKSAVHNIGGLQLRLPRVEDLLVMKAIARRPKDIEDIRGLLAAHPEVDESEARRWVREFATAMSMSDICGTSAPLALVVETAHPLSDMTAPACRLLTIDGDTVPGANRTNASPAQDMSSLSESLFADWLSRLIASATYCCLTTSAADMDCSRAALSADLHCKYDVPASTRTVASCISGTNDLPIHAIVEATCLPRTRIGLREALRTWPRKSRPQLRLRLDDQLDKLRCHLSVLGRAFDAIQHRFEYAALALQTERDLRMERFRLGGERGIECSELSVELPHFANLSHERDDGLRLDVHRVHGCLAVDWYVFAQLPHCRRRARLNRELAIGSGHRDQRPRSTIGALVFQAKLLGPHHLEIKLLELVDAVAAEARVDLGRHGRAPDEAQMRLGLRDWDVRDHFGNAMVL